MDIFSLSVLGIEHERIRTVGVQTARYTLPTLQRVMPFIVDDNQFPPEKYEYYLRLFHQNVAAHKREAEQAAKQATSSLESVDDKQSSSTKTKSTSDATGPQLTRPTRKPPSPPKARSKKQPTTHWRPK